MNPVGPLSLSSLSCLFPSLILLLAYLSASLLILPPLYLPPFNFSISPFPHQSLPAVVPVIQDRLPVRESSRLSEALETAFTLGKGKLALVSPSSNTSLRFSRGWHCASCDLEIRQPSPALFSFNNPLGACPDCRGFGRVIGIDLDRPIPDQREAIAASV